MIKNQFNSRNIKLCLWAFFLAFFVFITYSYLHKTFAFHFVDEEDNFILGKYIVQGEKLYKDLFSHHQPLAYILSSIIQKVTKPSSVFLLIKRHREFVLVWSALWSLFLLWRFGVIFVPLIVVLELTKISLLGNLFLAESLSLYPLVYISSILFSKTFSKKEVFLVGLVVGIIAMLLSPLWPLLILIIGLLFMRLKRRGFLLMISGVVLIILTVLPFISLKEYFLYSWYTNYRYYIPITVKESQLTLILQSFFAPILTLLNFHTNTPSIWIFKVLSFGWLVALIVLLRRRRFLPTALLFLLPGLANLRFNNPGQEEYSGFHLIPWFGVMMASLWGIGLDFWKSKETRLTLLLFCGLLLAVTTWKTLPLHLKKNDQQTDFYVHYSTPIDIGSAVEIMKDTQDTLMVVPDEWLVYWQADIKHSSVMVNFYDWMNRVPYLYQAAHQPFDSAPPTFLYLNQPGTGFEMYLRNYQQLFKDGTGRRLYVLKTKVKRLTAEQLSQLVYRHFVFLNQ